MRLSPHKTTVKFEAKGAYRRIREGRVTTPVWLTKGGNVVKHECEGAILLGYFNERMTERDFVECVMAAWEEMKLRCRNEYYE